MTSWREETADTGIRFLGTLENGSPDFAALLSVEVSLYDEAGALIDTRPARLAKSSLGPGANTTFDVLFDGVYAHGDVIFTPDGRSLRSRTREEAAGEATPEAEGEDAETAIAPEATAPDEPPPAP